MIKKIRHKLVFCLSVLSVSRAGISVFAKNLFESLSKIGHSECELVSFRNPFLTLGKQGFVRKFFSILRIVFDELIVLKGNAEAVFFFPTPLATFSMLIFKRKFAITIHDLFALKNPDKTTFFASLQMRLISIFVRKAYRIFTISDYSRQEIAEFFSIPKDRIFIVKNGLDPVFINGNFLPLQSNLVEELPQHYILNVGSIEPRKNLVFLIEVFDEVQKRLKKIGKVDFKLLLTGSETWRCKDVFDRIEESPYKDDIIILGYIKTSDLPILYRRASVMVFPSVAEGFGIPVIEALSQGTYVLLNDNTALGEFGPYGVILKRDYKVAEWADEVLDIVNGDLRLSKEKVESVKKDFSWYSSAECFLEVFFT